jgi:hypothetical protein
MLNESQELLNQLKSRLPELEWKITEIDSFYLNQRLSKGLFRLGAEASGAAFIAEIKADIQSLSLQQNKQSAFYQAQRIQQKINVLVTLCQMHQKKNKKEEKVYFGVSMLSTRQQWIRDLEMKITTLVAQQQAMNRALKQFNHVADAHAILQLKADLGEVERRLTLAQETLNRAIS